MSTGEQPPAPQPVLTPTGYERTSAGGFRWQPPTVEHLQALLPQYEILSLLGHGGMGAVYKARQKTLDRLVAIKILPPEAASDGSGSNFVERFRNEARTMAKLNHPAIVHVHDFGETSEGQMYFIMEFVEGTDVQKMIAASGKLPAAHALAIAAHVCDALQYAHTHGVVHRDIKPANVLINMEGQVKVADFGLAKLEDGGHTQGLTMTGMAMGTPDYVAPEALAAGIVADHRADLYAVGVMLYHMLTGEVPRGKFKAASTKTGGDPRFDAIIDRAMENDRDERYQTAQLIRQDLDTILATPEVKSGGQSSAAIPKQSLPQKPVAKGPQQRPAAAPVATPPPAAKSKTPMLIGAGVAAVAAAGFFLLQPAAKEEPKPLPPSVPTIAEKPKTPVAKPAPKPVVAEQAPAKAQPAPKPAPETPPVKMPEPAPAPVAKSTESAPAKTLPQDVLPAQEPVHYTFPLAGRARPTQSGQVVVWRLDGTEMGEDDRSVQPPSDLIDVVQVASFPTRTADNPIAYHVIALRADGTVRVWGAGSASRIPIPKGLKDVVGVYAAGSRSSALTSESEFVYMGATTGRNMEIGKRGDDKVMEIFVGDGFDNLHFESGTVKSCRIQLTSLDEAISKSGPCVLFARMRNTAACVLPNGELQRIFDSGKMAPPVPFLRAPAVELCAVAGDTQAIFVATDGKRVVGVNPERAAGLFAGMSQVVSNGTFAAGKIGDQEWKFLPNQNANIEYCEKHAKGCFALAITDKYVFGIKPADPALLAEARRKVAVGVMAATPTPAPEASSAPQTELDKRLATLEAQFQTAAERDAGKTFKDAVAQLNKGYVGALDRILAPLMQAGRTDAALKVRDEKQGVEKGDGVPLADDESTLPELKKARATYREAFKKLETDYTKKLVPLYGFYDKALDSLRVELTKAGKLDDAQKVTEVRAQIAVRRDGGTVKPEAVPVSPPTTLPTKTPASSGKKAPTVKLDPEASRKAAQWALDKGANISIISRNAKVNVQAGQELPKGPVQLLSISYPTGKTIPITEEDVQIYTRAVELTGFNAGDRNFIQFTSLSNFKNTPLLEHFEITGYGELNAEDCEIIGSFSKLKTLGIAGGSRKVISDFEKIIASIELTVLNVNGRQLTAHDYEAIGKKALTNLTLGAVGDDALEHLGGLDRLTTLSLSNGPVTEVGYRALNPGLGRTLATINCGSAKADSSGAMRAIIEKFPVLKDLQIRGAIDATAVAQIGKLTNLKRLSMQQAEISPAHIAAIAQCKSLEALELGNGQLSAADVAELKRLRGLAKLKIYGNGIKLDPAVLTALPELKHLTDLDLPDDQVTGDQADALRKLMPKCNISLIKPYQ